MTRDELRSLMAVPPAEFVASRNALAKELQASGRRDDADAVKRLRRPRVAEHVLNLVAVQRPEVVARWAEAVIAVEAAQSAAIGGARGDELRAVSAEWRAATTELVEAGVTLLGAAGEAQRADLIATVRTLGNPAGATLVREGIVGSEQLGETAMFAGAPEPVVRERPARSRPAPRTAPEPPRPDPVVVRRLRSEAMRARTSLGVAEREVERARATLAEAERHLDGARTAASAADAALAELLDPR